MKFASAALFASAVAVPLTWDDCGDASTHGHVTDISPLEIPLGKTTTLTGKGTIDQDINSATFSFVAKLGPVPLLKGSGNVCEDNTIELPLGAGSILVHAIDCPAAAGDVELKLDIDALASASALNGLVNIQLDVASDTGDKVLCAHLTTTSKDIEVPNGLKVDLTPEEMDAAMALNAQYEKEFAEGNYVGPADITAGSGMTKCNQKCSNWCWATGATMAASAFGGGSNCANNEESVAEYIYGTPCSTSCPNNCNQGGTTADIANGIKHLSGHSYKTGNVLSQSALDSALAHGPVVVGVQWSGSSSGHAITLSGKSGGNYKIHDPEGEDHTVPYSGVTTYVPNYAQGSYTGKWFGTAYTSSGAETVV